MSHLGPFSADQWIQQYQNTGSVSSGGEWSIATTITADKDSVHGNASSNNQAQGSGGKPIRRRSRASKKTPTTLLNASPTDFRALVQRFTGYNPGNASSGSSGSLPKGPLNINFVQNDPNENSRYGYYSNQQSLPLQVSQGQDLQGVGGLNDPNMRNGLPGYGMHNASVDHELVDESSSFTEAAREGSYFY